MVTTDLTAAIAASPLATNLTEVGTALVTLTIGVVTVVAVLALVIGGIKKIAGMVAGAGHRI